MAQIRFRAPYLPVKIQHPRAKRDSALSSTNSLTSATPQRILKDHQPQSLNDSDRDLADGPCRELSERVPDVDQREGAANRDLDEAQTRRRQPGAAAHPLRRG